MLEQLRVSNFAVIDELEVDFGPGLTTLTGETGAGKSILLGALKLALGERATTETLRTGAERATIEVVWREVGEAAGRWLEESGFAEDPADDQLIVRRVISASGSSRNFINNRAATLGQLKELGDLLLDLHGQHDHQSLFSPAMQLRLLDNFGGHERELGDYRSAYGAYRESRERCARLDTDQSDAERRKSFLAFQVEEIAKAGLSPGEDESLETERRRLQNAERLGAACNLACDVLYEGERNENPASALIAAAVKALSEVATLDPSQEGFVKDAESLRFAAEDLAARVQAYAANVAVDPSRLAAVEDRLDLVRSLKKKYGATIAEIIATRDALASELSGIENRDAALAEARQAETAAAEKLVEAAKRLSSRRAAAARKFEKLVEKEMRELYLPKAVFRVELRSGLDGGGLDACGVQGAESVEFVIALNPGEDARPLRKVASGGELSRIMLAIKSVLAGKDEIPTLIFDEIDVGVSGEAAARVGEKLKELGESHQVICITHLPQIAARGDSHLIVEKRVAQGRTRVAVRALEGTERAAALAQMLSGDDVDDASRRYAERLLQQKSR